jgi:hypothetical protein
MQQLLSLLLLIYAMLPCRADTVDDYADIARVKERMAASPLHLIEGIWQFPEDGATIAIEREVSADPLDNNEWHYRMVVIKSPSRSLLPGTVMGRVRATAKRNSYAATIYTDTDGGSRMLKPKKFTLTLSDDSRLTFRRKGATVRLQLWRMLPYVSRLGVRVYHDRDADDDDGCVRIFPATAGAPIQPRYL